MTFSDTVQCPTCRHVLNRDALENPTVMLEPSSVVEDPCPNCGELVRRGLVRCWQCGGFMREDIAETYRQMKASPQPVIYSEIPTDVLESILDDGFGDSQMTFQAGDRDFELSSDYETQMSTAVTAAESDAGGTYSISPLPAETVEVSAAPVPADDENTSKSADGEQSKRTPPEEPDVDHSVATGGDALLIVALQEEAEEKRRRRKRKARRRLGPRSATGLLVFCPHGHRIEVQQRFRGQTGRCPKCKTPFFVPLMPEPETSPEQGGKVDDEQRPAEAAGIYLHWMQDVHVHVINPERLKLKAGSLQNDFRLYDLGFSAENILAVSLSKRKGAAGAASKKRLSDREAMLTHLREGKAEDELPAAEYVSFSSDQLRMIAVVQPAAYAHESMFAGIPVFGAGQIAVRLSPGGEQSAPLMASFPLSAFRRFAALLDECFGIKNLGEDCGVPLTDSFSQAKCHYSDESLKILENADFYQDDPGFEITLIGRRCQGCGLTVSEDSRKKEKIGGLNGKSIAKAVCPKCKKKFGDTSLFTLDVETEPTPEENADAETNDHAKEEDAPTAATTS